VSNISITNVVNHYEVTAYADVHGAESRQMLYSRRGDIYRPTRLKVRYHWTSEDTEQTAHVELSGKQIRKDGSEGQDKHETLWARDGWPDWVAEFVRVLRPSAATKVPL
jgi:hypothetical protein